MSQFHISLVDVKGKKQVYPIRGKSFKIGGGRFNDLTLEHPSLSRKHCVFKFERGAWYIEDLGSMSGTWVNEERVISHGPLTGSETIRIGECLIEVMFPEEKSASSGHSRESAATSAHRPAAADDTSSGDIIEGQALVIHPASNRLLMLDWQRKVHKILIQQMDLRRKNLHKLSDAEVRVETARLLDDIIDECRDELPDGVHANHLKKNVLDEAIGLGPLEELLADESVSEIMVNNASQIFVERNGKLSLSSRTFTGNEAVLSAIDRIITKVGRRIDESMPMVDARLPDGSRVNAIIPPVAIQGPTITIRKFSRKRLEFSNLETYGSLNAEMVKFLQLCVRQRKNIIVSGGTGTGKTTLLNVLSNEIPIDERVITVEDAAELRLSMPNLISLEARPSNAEGKGQISIRDLVRNALRMRPDRIVVGECRGGEALDMLQAMNTGHDGSLTTAHANSPRDAISRLEVMVMMSGMDLPVQAIREQLASAVDIIVQQTRYPCGSRKVTAITEVTGMESGTIQLQDIFTFRQKGLDAEGRVRGLFGATGFVPNFYEDLEAYGIKVDRTIFRKPEELF
jgi:pilus assembly protein CpaF